MKFPPTPKSYATIFLENSSINAMSVLTRGISPRPPALHIYCNNFALLAWLLVWAHLLPVVPRSDTSLVALLSKENKCYLILDIRLCNVVKEEKDCNLKGWGQTMITFLPPLRSMLLPLHPLQPELHRKQCVRVYWCVSIDIRPVIILSHAKNQTCTLSLFLQTMHFSSRSPSLTLHLT